MTTNYDAIAEQYRRSKLAGDPRYWDAFFSDPSVVFLRGRKA